ncbi:hypothetical protein LLH23_21830 [bacterium]|nr:hypothetical protein [bacterium]
MRRRISWVMVVGVVVVVAVVIGAVVFVPGWRDDRAFAAAQGTQAAGDPARAAEAYQQYLRRFPAPKGRHFGEAEAALESMKEEKAREAHEAATAAVRGSLRSGLSVVLSSHDYEGVRSQLREKVRQSPGDLASLLQLALLAWGIDRFDRGAYEESERCIEAIGPGKPESDIAKEIHFHNFDHWCVDFLTPRSALGSMFARLKTPYREGPATLRPSGRNEVTVEGANMQVVQGMPTVKAGQRLRFTSDGTLDAVLDASGKTVWRVSGSGGREWVCLDAEGRKHKCVAPMMTGKVVCISLEEIAQSRKSILDTQYKPSYLRQSQ